MFNATEKLKHKLDKLMANPEKPVEIPKKKDKKFYDGPDFVRNIMGSSAGAGSGEFHVYRHLRRKEYARQKEMDIESKHDTLNDKYHQKLEENKRLAEERTAKKRNKRLKKKALKLKRKKTESKQQPGDESRDEESADESDSESNQSSPGKPVETADKEEDISGHDKAEEPKPKVQ